MKKIALTIAIVLGITLGGIAQGRGLFDRGPESKNGGYYGYDASNNRDDEGLLLPTQHGLPTDQESPLGTGILLLAGFGAAYALKKKNK